MFQPAHHLRELSDALKSHAPNQERARPAMCWAYCFLVPGFIHNASPALAHQKQKRPSRS